MIDEGYHPMTMYFPLVVHGAMLIEPTESESKECLDRFIRVMAGLAQEAKAGQDRPLLRRAVLRAHAGGWMRHGQRENPCCDGSRRTTSSRRRSRFEEAGEAPALRRHTHPR